MELLSLMCRMPFKRPTRGSCQRMRRIRAFRKSDESNMAADVEVMKRKNKMTIGMLNVEGCKEQGMVDVEAAVLSRDMDIMILIETHMRKEDKLKLSLRGYEVFETRRATADKDKKGGGLAMMVRKKDGMVCSQYKPKISNPDLAYVEKERMWLTTSTSEAKTAVCAVYLACYVSGAPRERQAGPWNDGILEVLTEEIFKLRGMGYRVCVNGDFNAHVGNNLAEGGIPGNRRNTNSNSTRFLNFLSSNNLVHLNGACRQPGDWSTRIARGLWTRTSHDYASSTVIDYVLVSKEHLDTVLDLEVDQDGVLGGCSDHSFMVTKLTDSFVCKSRVMKDGRNPGWDLKEDQDWTRFKQVLEREREAMKDDDGSAEGLAGGVQRILLAALNEGVGRRQIRPSGGKAKFPSEIVKLMKESRDLERVWKTEKSSFAASRSGTPNESLVVALQRYNDSKSEVRAAVQAFQRQKRRPMLKACSSKKKKDRKFFWNYVSRKEKGTSNISALQQKSTGIMMFKSEQLAEEVTGYMIEIFTGSKAAPEPVDPVLHPDDHGAGQQDSEGEHGGDGEDGPGADREQGIKSEDQSRTSQRDPSGFLDRDYSIGEVQSMITSLGNGKAAGWDEIPNEALKNVTPGVLKMLVNLFNRVKNSGVVPKSWKKGRLVLVHKKGATTDVGNYRPLTVIEAVAGLYTKLLNKRLVQVVEDHKLLGEIQNGFRQTRSGTDCGFILNTVIWKSAAQRKKIHLAFLDLQKGGMRKFCIAMDG